MGVKANTPERKRRKKRHDALVAKDSAATADNKVAERDERAASNQAFEVEPHPRRLFPESVPPAMVAEVFDVAGADDDTILSSIPPPPPPPPPHPSRTSVHGELDEAGALELPSDALEAIAPRPPPSSGLR